MKHFLLFEWAEKCVCGCESICELNFNGGKIKKIGKSFTFIFPSLNCNDCKENKDDFYMNEKLSSWKIKFSFKKELNYQKKNLKNLNFYNVKKNLHKKKFIQFFLLSHMPSSQR